ncbi:hypothetical protein LWI28_025541 [Acer negundo]|uniref:Glutathione peroxidase n=1 Tax=Acer negundo TaxID=4023 RepID=A0AAD5P0D1_ACENE|nr:hypothetical protein LWI28_025541 [Acer negundo]
MLNGLELVTKDIIPFRLDLDPSCEPSLESLIQANLNEIEAEFMRAKDAIGNDVDLSTYEGKILLIVNVASQCGLTNSKYTELSRLYEKYKNQGLEILAFPCNQFGAQEPGNNEQILEFSCTRFKAEYPIFDKVTTHTLGHRDALETLLVISNVKTTSVGNGPLESLVDRVILLQSMSVVVVSFRLQQPSTAALMVAVLTVAAPATRAVHRHSLSETRPDPVDYGGFCRKYLTGRRLGWGCDIENGWCVVCGDFFSS